MNRILGSLTTNDRSVSDPKHEKDPVDVKEIKAAEEKCEGPLDVLAVHEYLEGLE